MLSDTQTGEFEGMHEPPSWPITKTNSAPAGCKTINRQWRDDVRDALINVLDSDCDEAVRFHALRALGILAVPESINALASAVEDADEDVRAVAVEALSNHINASHDNDAIQALLLRTLHEDPAPDCKIAAIDGLSQLGTHAVASAQTMSTLAELCTDRGANVQWDDASNDSWDDWLDVQVAAIRALARMASPESAGGSASTSANVERIIACINCALHDEQAQELASVACSAFSQLGAHGRAELQNCLSASRGRLRREALSAILRAPHIQHLTRLEALLSDADEEIRAAALKALLTLGQADKHFATTLGDPSPNVIISALTNCSAAQASNLVGTITKSLTRHLDSKVRVATAHMLTRIAPKMSAQTRDALSAALAKLLSDPSVEVVSAAVEAAAAMLGNGAVSLLSKMLNDSTTESPVRKAIVAALARVDDSRSVTLLASALTEDDWQVRHCALTAVSIRANSGDQQAQQALYQLLELDNEENDVTTHADLSVVADSRPVSPSKSPPKSQEAAIAAIPVITPIAARDALSTLDEIIADNNRLTDDIGVVLDDDDAQRLSSATIKPRQRKHVALEPDASAVLDAARFAARSLAQCPSQDTQTALERALQWHDDAIVNAALTSLIHARQRSASPTLVEKLETLSCTGSIDNQVLASRALMQFGEPNGVVRCREFLQAGDILACRTLLQLIAQRPLDTDRCLEGDLVALFKIEQLRSASLSAIAVINPARIVENLLPLIGGGDEAVHQLLGSMLHARQLAPAPAARALLAGLDDPKWTTQRVWIIEVLQRLL